MSWLAGIFKGVASLFIGVFALVGISNDLPTTAAVVQNIPIESSSTEPLSTTTEQVQNQPSSSVIAELQKQLNEEKTAREQLQSKVSALSSKKITPQTSTTTSPPPTSSGSATQIPSGAQIGGPGDAPSPAPSKTQSELIITGRISDNIINIKSSDTIDVTKTHVLFLNDSGSLLANFILTPTKTIIPNYSNGYYYYTWNPTTPISQLVSALNPTSISSYKVQVMPNIGAGLQTSEPFTSFPADLVFQDL